MSSFSVLRLYAHSHPLREGDPVLRDMGPIWKLNKTLQKFLSPCVGKKVRTWTYDVAALRSENVGTFVSYSIVYGNCN